MPPPYSMLVLPKRGHRVDPGRAAGRDVSCRECHACQEQGSRDVCHQVERLDKVEQVPRDFRESEAQGDSQGDPQRDPSHGLGDDRTQHTHGRGAKRYPNADLACALNYGKGNHAVKADARKDEAESAGSRRHAAGGDRRET